MPRLYRKSIHVSNGQEERGKRVCVCVCLCLCVCVCVCVYARVVISTPYICMYVYVRLKAYTHIYIYTCKMTCLNLDWCTCVSRYCSSIAHLEHLCLCVCPGLPSFILNVDHTPFFFSLISLDFLIILIYILTPGDALYTIDAQSWAEPITRPLYKEVLREWSARGLCIDQDYLKGIIKSADENTILYTANV